MFVNGDGQAMELADLYRGSDVFLVLNGPSAGSLDLAPLTRPGFLTAGMNNGPRHFRPDLWFCCDRPSRFLPSIWHDPKIMKFARLRHHDRPVKRLEEGDVPPLAKSCPNTVWFAAEPRFKPETFLTGTRVQFGNRLARSTLLAALRVLYSLGIRRVYLLGCDFHMPDDQPYAFREELPKGHADANNRAYGLLLEFCRCLQPHFLEHGFQVFNCTVGSRLNAFPFADYDTVVNDIAQRMERRFRLERDAVFYFRGPPPVGSETDDAAAMLQTA